MPVYTDLWAINNKGKVCVLSTQGNHWQEKKYYGLEFKRLSTTSRCTWAIGGDHQVYLYVSYSDVPIRVKEVAYENQRWNPYEGFTSRLLPSDRPVYSSSDGSKSRFKDEICLPNSSWQWESPWYLENSIDGQPLGKEGWTYAVDFPRNFSKIKKWSSCVRRRKWLRYRKFMAMNSWTLIPAISEDPTSEPFIDIAVGGTEIPGGDVETYVVWGVTILGRVFFREGVTLSCPEGVSWTYIPTPNDCEVNQISVGPTGLVWAVNWDGEVIVRLAVDRHNIEGLEWSKVNCECKIEMVSVGMNCVWAICRDNKIWFRTGVDGRNSGANVNSAEGSGWVEMVGLMSTVSVGMNDQVFAIGLHDKELYFRTGITYDEPNGRTWKRLSVPVHAISVSHSDSEVSIASMLHQSTERKKSINTDDVFISSPNQEKKATHSFLKNNRSRTSSKYVDKVQSTAEVDHRKHESISVKIDLNEKYLISSDSEVEATEAAEVDVLDEPDIYSLEPATQTSKFNDKQCNTVISFVRSDSVNNESALLSERTSKSDDDTPIKLILNELVTPNKEDSTVENMIVCRSQSSSSSPDLTDAVSSVKEPRRRTSIYDDNTAVELIINETKTSGTEDLVTDHKVSYKSQTSSGSSNVTDTVVDFVNDISDVESSPHHSLEPFSFKNQHSTDGCAVNDESQSEVWMNQLEDRMCYGDDQADDFSWCWVCPRSCSINPQSLPNWFFAGSISSESSINQPWRIDIISQFEKRYDKEMKNFSGKYEEAIKNAKWVKTTKCKVFSESRPHQWAEGIVELERQGAKSEGNLDKGTLICSYRTQHRVETTLPEITCIVSTFLPSHSGLTIYTAKRVSKQQPLKLSFRSNLEMEDWLASLYAACYDLRRVRGRADKNSAFAVSAHGEIYSHTTMADMESASCNQMFWRFLGGGHLMIVESCYAGVVWGIGYDNTAWVYTGGYGGGVFKGISGFNSEINTMHDSMRIFIYENQRWNPLTGFSTRSLPTDRHQWSDQNGLYECTKENTKLPSTHWTWSTEWCIDYKVPGGADNEGWQYAYDFPRTYHGHKGFTDYVRRRRWFRKCNLVTSGPWKEVTSTPLLALSVQVDHSGNESDPVALWAIGTNGDALCRVGVTAACPAGVSWEHVPADQPFQSITVGGYYKVWTVARDGSAFLRHGITKDNFTGDVWFHLEPPTPGVPLKQISCGKNTVMAVDSAKKLWCRQEILPHFPEGTSWKFVHDNVHQVSVGSLDQVWVIMDTLDMNNKTVNGVICRRIGITDEVPVGDGWDYGMAGGWQHISVRACRPDFENKVECADEIKPTFKPNAETSKIERNISPIC